MAHIDERLRGGDEDLVAPILFWPIAFQKKLSKC